MDSFDSAPFPTGRSLFALRDEPRTWLGYLCLVGVLAAVCFASLSELRLDIHDDETFRDNVAIHRNFAFFFSADKEQVTGRPVAELAKYLVYLPGKNDPAAHHLAVVVVHVVASLLLALLSRRTGLSMEVSMAGGVLFLLNVAHFQAVHQISALDYPLALAWTSAAGICYLRMQDSGRRIWPILFYATLTLGVFSHIASMAVWPFLLYRTWNRERDFRAALRRLLPAGILLIFLGLVVVAITEPGTTIWMSLEEMQSEEEEGILFRGLRLLLWYLSRLLTTAHALPIPYYERQTWELYVGACCLAGLLALVWKRDLPGSGWAAWTVLFLLPFLFVPEELLLNLPSSPSRYLYMASAGSSLLISWGLAAVCLRIGRWGRALYGAVLAGLLLSSYGALKQTEALSLYSSGRYYIAKNDEKTGIDQLQRAIALGSETIDLEDAYNRLCMVLIFEKGDDFEAYLRAGREAFPDDPTLRIFQLTMESMQADSALAGSAREQLENMRQHPDATDLIARSYFNWGKRFSEQEDHVRAISAYERSLEFMPDRTNALKELGLSLMKLGGIEEAQEAFRRAYELDPQDHRAIYGLALALERDGECEKAIELCRRGLQIRPWSYTSRLLGRCLEQLGRHAEALDVYRQALVLYPDDGMLYLQQARTLLATGDRAAAAQALEQVARLMPEKQSLLRDLADLYFREKQFAEAAATYRTILRLDPSNPVVRAYLGHALRALGQEREAEQAYRQVVEQRPGDPVAHFNLGSLLRQEGKRQPAVSELEKAVQSGSVAIETYRLLARCYEEDGRSEDVLELFRLPLSRALPNAGSAFFTQLGGELLKRQAVDGALQAYRRALEEDAGNQAARVNLGWCLYLRGELDEAIDAYRTVLSQQAGSAAQFNLGLALLARGDVGAAREAYARGVRQFGAEEGVRIGAVDDLQALIARGIAGSAGEEILRTHWPGRAN